MRQSTRFSSWDSLRKLVSFSLALSATSCNYLGATPEGSQTNRQATSLATMAQLKLGMTSTNLESSSHSYVYVMNANSYSISSFLQDESTGLLTKVESASVNSVTNPDLLDPEDFSIDNSGNYLFEAGWSSNTLVSFARDPNTGKLTQVQKIGTGYTPFTVVFHPNSRFVYVTNFGANTISLYHLDSSSGLLTHVEDMSSQGNTPGFMGIDSSGSYMYVMYYRENKIRRFKIDPDSGELTYIQDSAVDTGMTPRLMSLTDKFAYVINQNGNTISSYKIDPETKQLLPLTTVALHGMAPFGIKRDPSNQRLYVVCQLSNSVDIFNLDSETGALEYTTSQELSGAKGNFIQARNIYFDSKINRAYVTHQKYGVTLYDVDPQTGKLAAVQDYEPGYGSWSVIIAHPKSS